MIGIVFISLIISGCGAVTPGGLYVWIDVPQDGVSFAALQPVIVKGHATGRGEITNIELYVEGELWRSVDDPEIVDDLARFEFEWLPPELGAYTLEAIVYDTEGNASQRDQTTIFFGLTPTPVVILPPVISITPTLTDTPTPVPPAEASVQFWADPGTIDAGDCTDIHWIAENVQRVELGGIEQPLEGVFEVCLCEGETYSLHVTYLDDSKEIFVVNIDVVGSCEEEDNDPPPAPIQSSPIDGDDLACIQSSINFVWSPVSDESGISEYQLEVARHWDGKTWIQVPGSVFTGITTTSKNVPIDCHEYRWRVRAVDGAGNPGPWSSWWYITKGLN